MSFAQNAKQGFVTLFKQHYILLLLLMAYFAVRYQYFEAPMERDEGIYVYFGQLMLDGKTPYLDFYEHRLPGIFYAYALMVAIFGTFKGLALGFTLINMASICLLYSISRRWLSPASAIWAAAAFAFLSIAPELSGYTRQSEHLVSFLMLLGLYALQKGLIKNSYLWQAISGFLMCAAMLTKPNGVFFIVMGGLIIVANYLYKKEYKNIFKYGIVYSISVFACFGLLLLLMVKNGTLDDMWYWSITFAADYSATIPLSEGITYFLLYFKAFFASYWSIFLFSVLGFIGVLIQKKSDTSKLIKTITWLFFIFSFLTITPGNRFYGHYWLMWLPAMAFCFGALHSTIAERLGSKPLQWGLNGLMALSLLIHLGSKNDYYIKPNLFKISRHAYSTNPFPEALRIGQYLQPKAKEGDMIAVLGSEPELYIYTGCRAPSRHSYFTYLLSDTTKAPANEWQEEFKKDVETNKPRFLVAFQHRLSLAAQPNANISILDWTAQLINSSYKRIGIVDDVGSEKPRYMWVEDFRYDADSTKFNMYVPKGKYNIQIFERR